MPRLPFVMRSSVPTGSSARVQRRFEAPVRAAGDESADGRRVRRRGGRKARHGPRRSRESRFRFDSIRFDRSNRNRSIDRSNRPPARFLASRDAAGRAATHPNVEEGAEAVAAEGGPQQTCARRTMDMRAAPARAARAGAKAGVPRTRDVARLARLVEARREAYSLPHCCRCLISRPRPQENTCVPNRSATAHELAHVVTGCLSR